jgi:MFS family permease
MSRDRLDFFYLNVGHFYDHFFLLIFATAVLTLTAETSMSYAELVPLGTAGFIAFGVCSIPAGYLADKWSRQGMMVVFFVGIGLASIAVSVAATPWQLAAGLTAIGVFAAIYHPVGIALVVAGRDRPGVALAVNGMFGNFGVACAALTTGIFIDTAGWQEAFSVPGLVAVATGIAYFVHWRRIPAAPPRTKPATAAGTSPPPFLRATLVRVFAIVMVSTAIGGFVFQGTTFALPKVFDERLGDLAGTATLIGGYGFIVFTVAAFAQLAVGYFVDRYPVRHVFGIVAALQAALFAAMYELTGLPALVVAVGFMLAVFGQIPINDVLVARIAREEWRSRVYAFRYVVTFLVAASTLPVIAWVHANWSFAVLFAAMAAGACVTLAAVLLLPRDIPSRGSATAPSP